MPVLLLEHGRIFAFQPFAVGAIAAIFRDLVDEEQGQHLDATRVEQPFAREMGADRLPDLHTANGRFAGIAGHAAFFQHDAIGEAQRARAGVDVRDCIAAILGEAAGTVFEVVALFQPGGLALHLASLQHGFDHHPGFRWRADRRADIREVEIAIETGQPLHRHAAHRNALH